MNIRDFSLEDTESGRVLNFEGQVIGFSDGDLPPGGNADTVAVRIFRVLDSQAGRKPGYAVSIVTYAFPPGGSGNKKLLSRTLLGPCAFNELPALFPGNNKTAVDVFREALKDIEEIREIT